MFTGIIEKMGTVSKILPGEASFKVTIDTTYRDLQLGESVAVNGVCLTVVDSTSTGKASFLVSSETLFRTNLGQCIVGTSVNLERAVTLQSRLSGHLVQGHVDAKAKLILIEPHEDCHSLTFELSRDFGKYCVEKGSVTLNGVSLTLNSVQDLSEEKTQLSVMIIPHTWKETNLSQLQIGSHVNVEVDVLAKYVEKLCHSLIRR